MLVLDPQLEPALKLVCEGSKALREHRVDAVLTLAPGAPPPSLASGAGDTVLYLCRPLPHLVRLVAALRLRRGAALRLPLCPPGGNSVSRV